MEHTQFFQLNLPGEDDPVDIEDINENFRKIDKSLLSMSETTANKISFNGVTETAQDNTRFKNVLKYVDVTIKNPGSSTSDNATVVMGRYDACLLMVWNRVFGHGVPLTTMLTGLLDRKGLSTRDGGAIVGYIGSPYQPIVLSPNGKYYRGETPTTTFYSGEIVRWHEVNGDITLRFYQPNPMPDETVIYYKVLWLPISDGNINAVLDTTVDENEEGV